MTRRMYCHESRKWVIYQKCSPTTLLLQVFTTHNFAQTTQYDGADHAPRCCSPRWSSSPHSRQRANAMRKRDCRLPRPKKVWLSLTPELTGPLFHWSAGYARGDHRRRPSTSAKSFTEVLNGLVRGSTNIRTMCAARGNAGNALNRVPYQSWVGYQGGQRGGPYVGNRDKLVLWTFPESRSTG